jgi:Leucyl-tRNA synthetase
MDYNEKIKSWIDTEKNIQKKWDEENDSGDIDYGKKKWHCVLPRPQLDGLLYLNDLFILLKSDFQARFKLLFDINVLFPLSFNFTNMLISTNKLKYEIENNIKDGPQTRILLSYGIDKEDIHKFQDPMELVRFFSEKAIKTLKKAGLYIDWKRSFVSTKNNSYYDSFIKWQFNKLKKSGNLECDLRPLIYSIKDNQPYMNHDRNFDVFLIKRDLWNIPCKKYVLWVIAIEDYVSYKKIEEIKFNKKSEFVLVNNKFITTNWIFKNLTHQLCDQKYEINKFLNVKELIDELSEEIKFISNDQINENHGF